MYIYIYIINNIYIYYLYIYTFFLLFFFAVASELLSVVMAMLRETLRKQLPLSPVRFLEKGLYDQDAARLSLELFLTKSLPVMRPRSPGGARQALGIPRPHFAAGPGPSHYLISFRLTYLDVRFGVGQVQGKGEQSQEKKSTGGSSGVGRAEGLLLVGAVQLRLHQALQGSEGEAWRGALCAGLPSLIRKSQAHTASSCQLAAPPHCFIVVTSTLPFLSFLSQIVGWETSKCRSLGCMRGIFVVWALSCPFAPGVMR